MPVAFEPGSPRSKIGVGLALALLAVAGACGGAGESRKPDGGKDAPISIDTGMDRPSKSNGTSCVTGSECASGQCVEGVCCNEACGRACFTCVNPGTEGMCLAAFVGTDPGDLCPAESPTTCGTTGVCDGAGNCARFSGNAGVVCAAEACVGFMRTTTGTCDNAGTCSGAITQACTPFQCAADGKTCRTTCMADTDCVPPYTCVSGSCGKKPIGAPCGADDECFSTICAQGRCCMAACSGTCRSCAVGGSEGTCRNVPDGMDPLGQCADEGMTTCGLDGQCNGMGACRKYPVMTVCGTDSCSAGAERLAGRCDAAGTCAPGMLRSCNPYVCGTTNCKTSCATNADCIPGFSCVGSVCVQKANGAICTTAAECMSGYCQQGVCCNDGCSATCKACNLTGTVGTCTNVANGTAPTPATQCTDMGGTSCGNDGMCNGAAACRNYAAGTNCAAASCTGSTLSSPRTCDGMGMCRAATTTPCAPFTCGTGACRTTCTMTSECTSGNTCVNNSCGKIPPGGACPSGMGSDCATGNCVNNICCNTACTGICTSCSIAGSVGTCTPIAAGSPPLVASQCPMAAASTCGNDGTCDGAGACRKYVTGTQCVAGSCTGSTSTSARLCDGAGVCAAATTSSCGAYTCDMAAGVCRNSCTTSSECVAPNICNANSCTLKPIGASCTMANECNSNFCAQGVCCNNACTGTCRSCNITGTVGTCSNVANGTAPTPATQCVAAASNTCGLDGMCNGMGACRNWAAGTQCAAGTCVGSTLTPQRTCDGAGVCRTVTSTLCDPYVCNTTTPTCKMMPCASNADCSSPNSCVSMSCGKLPVGASCMMAAQCNSGFCAQGVCCGTACAGTCVSCNLAASIGTCASVPAGQDPLDQCADQGASTCGTDGTCNGGGACRMYGAGTQCVAPSCTGSTLTSARTCNGTGTCQAATTSSCMAYGCNPTACKTTCSTNADCAGAPYVCTGMTCGTATNVTVQVAMREIAPNNPAVSVDFKLYNNGTTPIPLSEMTLRYYYTIDTAQMQTAFIDYAAVGNGNVSLAFVAISPAKTNADFYVQVSFAAAAGSLAAGANTSNIQARWNKNDFSNYNEANDYSFTNSLTFMAWNKVTVYRLGVLVYGIEPP